MVPSERSLPREVGVGWGKRKEPFLKRVTASVFNFKTHIGGSGFDLVVKCLPSVYWALGLIFSTTRIVFLKHEAW